ncbi:unnamed protein product (macronuclear) [Paramecium tetraurelia]|uniref:Tetratricopeptide repeat protein n=1 Tax=Paramecium tetraurelia TaxID=5888 RepID=A0D5G5_PARTE|nr:uncharacterized protein GSPATT00039265001 [Paramecium tetraurelia]CAK78282.1 unnamed protein product [Paramecium tetraurelia]|eukprot:XP_001445679.1 hypothetical protein (macronuclear) [Paramecium tetraurelia strain d4-2]
MQQIDAYTIKCPNSEHAYDVKLICFNESCRVNRLYCIQCVRDGCHVSHHQNQQELPKLFEFIQKIQKECNDLITSLCKQMDLAYQQFHLLIDGIRSKYQKSKQQFLNLNSKQMNSFFAETIQFKSFQQAIDNQIQQSIKQFQNQMQEFTSNLKLAELNYYSISNTYILMSEELYEKGNQSIKLGYQLYQNDKRFEEAIKLFDQALIFNSTHQLSLFSESLWMLSKYNEAIIWADKALEVDPKHCNSLFCKGQILLKLLAQSLRRLSKYNEAIIWADKALEVDPKHCNSLCCKESKDAQHIQ